jgi:hypothetical protein
LNIFLGGVICECIARLEELEVAIIHGFAVECVYCHVLEICFWDVLQQRCKGNGEICCRLGWTCCVSFGNEIIVFLSEIAFRFALIPVNLLSFYWPIFYCKLLRYA